MKFDRFIGIDPGKGGAIAHINKDNRADVVSMPGTVEEMEIYFGYLKDISECPIACVEKVNLWRSDQNEGKLFGIEKLTRNLVEITTALRILRIPFIQVYPIQWQSYLNLRIKTNQDKEKLVKDYDKKVFLKGVAQEKYPYIKATLTNCDALLIMHFLGLKAQREPEWILERLPNTIVQKLDL